MCSHYKDHHHTRGRSCMACSDYRMERFIEPCLLLLLLEKPAHGYDLITRLREFGFAEDQDPGMVYRNLRRLEEQGAIASEWDTSGTGPARRLYEVTDEGRDLLNAWADNIKLNIETLQSFLERHQTLDP